MLTAINARAAGTGQYPHRKDSYAAGAEMSWQ